ncbi:allophanate hydrolase [Marisediminicola senii]|uniref:allophanate hydrolase n=1 Tax=Marisediminicola senii TaxID=2711233 RepID=UPI0013E9F56D|nr:allophanate hydrolase [Marisediminicola senii]
MTDTDSLTFEVPVDAAAHVASRYARFAAVDRAEAFITLRPEADVALELNAVLARRRAGEPLPLAGLLFAVKGNIDIAGIDTTAGCPAFAYSPAADATVVARLRAAGAVVLGSTNLDQFATGLVGTRSPYGAMRHATDPTRISGGSSSGSAVAVATGFADFALGTDTAGSGRVPAAFHGLVGLKPTKGWVPATGVVPACRTQDVVSVMSASLDMASLVVGIMAGVDAGDPLSRAAPAGDAPGVGGGCGSRPARIGVPLPGQLGELAPGWAAAFDAAVERHRRAGHEIVEVDVQPFLDTARMLYEGAFVAERYAAVGEFIDAHPGEVDPTVQAIIGGAREIPAHRLYRDLERLEGYVLVAAGVFSGVDALLLPTTVQHPTLAAVAADPLGVNGTLGRFTNFANLLDLAALAIPAGIVDGLPFGVQLVGPAFSDGRLADLARDVLEVSA